MKKVSTKVVRLIELAKEFEKSENDIFGQEDIYGGKINTFDIATFNPNPDSVAWKEITTKGVSLTRGQLIESKAKFAKEKADRYDEYQALKREVSEYFQAKLTINK